MCNLWRVALSAQARSGAAPSLDRILLLCARLACLASPAHPSPDLNVLVVGGGPIGLMSAIQARLVGVPSVTIWDKRLLANPRRDNVVDMCESDRSAPAHPAALTLLENLGILQFGLTGAWSRSLFPRYLHAMDKGDNPDMLTWFKRSVRESFSWLRPPYEVRAAEAGSHARTLENEWALKIEIREVENILYKLALVLGVHLNWETQFVDVLPPENSETAAAPAAHSAPQVWRAVGRRVKGGGETAENVTAAVHVLVGADGEWSSVRERCGFELITPEVRLKMSTYCAARARDNLQQVEASGRGQGRGGGGGAAGAGGPPRPCRPAAPPPPPVDGFDGEGGEDAGAGAGGSRCKQRGGAGVGGDTNADQGLFEFVVATPDCQHVEPTGDSGEGFESVGRGVREGVEGGVGGGVDMGVYVWRPLIVSAQVTVAAECGARQRCATPPGSCRVCSAGTRADGLAPHLR